MAEENRWWGALRVTPPEDTGAKGQEVADPAASGTVEGGKAQEVTDPAETEPQNTAGKDSQEIPANGTAEGAGQAQQSPEERKKQAEQRRERERQELEQRIRQEETEKNSQKMKSIFASLGLADDEGNAIETMEAFEAFQAAQRAKRIQKDLRSGNLTPEALREAVLGSPEVKAVLDKAQQTTREAEEARNKANRESYAASMQQELEAIRKIDPSIQSTDDIIRKETGPEYARLLRLGLKPSEAFRLANYDAIRDRDRNAAEQAARNAAAGKSHVQSTPAAGKQPLSAPEEYKRNMRRYIPDMTDKEIDDFYRRNNK